MKIRKIMVTTIEGNDEAYTNDDELNLALQELKSVKEMVADQ